MVKKIRKFKSTRRRRYYQFLKAISNYAYTKMTLPFRIKLDYQGAKFLFENQNDVVLGMPNFLVNCSDWPSYRNLYLSFKIKAIRIRVCPLPSPDYTGGQQIAQFNNFDSAVHIGLIANSDNTDVKSVAESEKNDILPWNEPRTIYWKFNESLTDWINTASTSTITSRLCLATFTIPQDQAFYKWWECTMDIYCLFKNAV